MATSTNTILKLIGLLFCVLGLAYLSYMKNLRQYKFTAYTLSEEWYGVGVQSVGLPKLQNKSNLDTWFSTFLLIIVPSRPGDQDSRQLIRDTWFEGFKDSKDVALRFALGTKGLEPEKRLEFIKENETFADIVFVDITEGSSVLTNKTLAIINWAHNHVKFSYLVKCDDDTYVFLKELIVELRKRQTNTKFYYGKILPSSKPLRGNIKWADNEWDLGPLYLPYAMGGCYILSYDLVAILSELSPYLKWHINEDTAVGAWLSAFDIERRSDERFCYWWKDVIKFGCIWSCCEQPILVFMLHGFDHSELKKQFNLFHEQPINLTTYD